MKKEAASCRHFGRVRGNPAKSTVAHLILWLVWVSPAEAYVDPGTGSMMLQMLGAVVVGAIFYLRDLRVRIRTLILSILGRSRRESADRDH